MEPGSLHCTRKIRRQNTSGALSIPRICVQWLCISKHDNTVRAWFIDPQFKGAYGQRRPRKKGKGKGQGAQQLSHGSPPPPWHQSFCSSHSPVVTTITITPGGISHNIPTATTITTFQGQQWPSHGEWTSQGTTSRLHQWHRNT